MYDNHTHLEIADGALPLDVHEHLERAASVGVVGAVQVGTDVATSRWSADVAAREPRLLAAVALHPNEAPELEAAGGLDEALAVIDELAARPRVRAIGETGLDFYRTGDDGRDAAVPIVRGAHRHREAARARAADPRPRRARRRRRDAAPGRRARAHGVPLLLGRRATSRGSRPTRGGTARSPATSRSRTPRTCARRCGCCLRDRILVETDAPYLTPAPLRGRPNAPYLVPHTARFMAEVRGDDLDEFCAQLASNTVAVYGSWQDEPVRGSDERGCGVNAHRHEAPGNGAVATPRLLGPAEIRDLAQLLDVTPTKKLGQNFVHDANTVRRIVQTAGVERGETVLEIGPGLGSLTLGLLEAGASVIAVEIDRRLAEQLPHTVRIMQPGTAARRSCTTTRCASSSCRANRCALVANLPYNVSVPVLLHLLEHFPSLAVGHRHGAGRGRTPPRRRAGLEGLRRAEREGGLVRPVAHRRPGVAHGVLAGAERRLGARRLRAGGCQPGTEAERVATFALVDAAFQQRRKMLRQSLSGLFGGSIDRERDA